MDKERRRIEDDLRGILRGDVDCDPVTTQLYASDASVYQIRPRGVIRPRTAGDIELTISYAAEHDLPLHTRGGGSGIAGESLGYGLVVDMSRYMRRIEVLGDGSKLHVESGATLTDINRVLRPLGRWYGPDPITRSITTIGSVIARDATGSHYLRSGSARDNIDSVEFVTAAGDTAAASRHDVDAVGNNDDDQKHYADPTTAGVLAAGVAAIRDRFADVLADRTGGRPTPGYRIDDCTTPDGRIDLAKFMCGAQGTLGVMTSATIHSEPIPPHRGVVMLFYHRLDLAVGGAIDALSHGVVACDWMDRRLLQIARDTDGQFRAMVPAAAEAMVLVEIQGGSLADLDQRLVRLKSALSRGPGGAFEAYTTTAQQQRDRFWSLSRRVIQRLFHLQTDQSPQPFIEDVRVDPPQLVPAILAIRGVLHDHDTTATMFGRMGQSSLHIRPFLNLAVESQRDTMAKLSASIAAVVWKHGGEIASTHAAGLSKTSLLPTQYGELWQAMGQVKQLFDPNQRLNPNKLFGASLQLPHENLRPSHRQIEVTAGNRMLESADREMAELSRTGRYSITALPVMQHWPPGGEVSTVSRLCNGCGRCRTTSTDQRQCPVFRAIPTEEATPRAKANLLRGVISGEIPVEELSGEKAKAVADLCFNCHQCRVDCPASVDIPKIVGELKAQYVAGNGQTLSGYFMSRIDSVAALASIFPWLSNRLMASPAARWVAQRTVGLSSARTLPPVARETFIRHASRRRLTRRSPHGGLKVCYFVDHYANHHEPEIGKAVVEVFAQNEIGLYVPPGQSFSGMARFTLGDIPAARKIARKNIRLLAEAVRAGYDIVATEPAAVLCLKHEYQNLLGTEDSLLVAEHTWDAAAYLWHLHQNDRLSTEFQSIDASVAYHQPCHLRVLDPDGVTVKLLNLIPGLNVADVQSGCTGMAGTWGLRRENYRNSLRIGWPLISAMRHADADVAATGCAACRMQIEHGAARSTVHPIKLLAHAYGRMPKVAKEIYAAE